MAELKEEDIISHTATAMQLPTATATQLPTDTATQLPTDTATQLPIATSTITVLPTATAGVSGDHSRTLSELQVWGDFPVVILYLLYS